MLRSGPHYGEGVMLQAVLHSNMEVPCNCALQASRAETRTAEVSARLPNATPDTTPKEGLASAQLLQEATRRGARTRTMATQDAARSGRHSPIGSNMLECCGVRPTPRRIQDVDGNKGSGRGCGAPRDRTRNSWSHRRSVQHRCRKRRGRRPMVGEHRPRGRCAQLVRLRRLQEPVKGIRNGAENRSGRR